MTRTIAQTVHESSKLQSPKVASPGSMCRKWLRVKIARRLLNIHRNLSYNLGLLIGEIMSQAEICVNNATKKLSDLYDKFVIGSIVDVGVCLSLQNENQPIVNRYKILDKRVHSVWSYSILLECLETKNASWFWILPETKPYTRIVSIKV